MVRKAGLSPDRVVEIALSIVDEQGLPALTLANVAQRAQVATPSLYKHVDSLADLRVRVGVVALSGLATRVNAAVAGVAGDDAVRALMGAYRAYVVEYPHRAWALVRPPQASDGAAVVLDVVLAVLRGYGLHGAEAVHAARAVRSATHGFAAMESEGGFGMPEELDVSFVRLQELVIAGLRALSASVATAPEPHAQT